jgi:hypothetical protein
LINYREKDIAAGRSESAGLFIFTKADDALFCKFNKVFLVQSANGHLESLFAHPKKGMDFFRFRLIIEG